MPAEGAAILVQIEDLLKQFMQLPYDTPVKQQAATWLDEVTQGVDELRGTPAAPGQDAALGPDAGGPPPDVAAGPQGPDMGPQGGATPEELAAGEQAAPPDEGAAEQPGDQGQGPPPPPHGGGGGFRGATQAALADHKKTGRYGKDQGQQVQSKKKRKPPPRGG